MASVHKYCLYDTIRIEAVLHLITTLTSIVNCDDPQTKLSFIMRYAIMGFALCMVRRIMRDY